MPWWDFASSSGQCRLEVLQYVQLVHKYGETSSLTQMLKHYRTLPSGCVLCGCPRVSGGAAAQIFPSHNEYHVINIQIVNVGECERHLHRSKKMHLGSEVIDKACHLGIKLTCGGRRRRRLQRVAMFKKKHLTTVLLCYVTIFFIDTYKNLIHHLLTVSCKASTAQRGEWRPTKTSDSGNT